MELVSFKAYSNVPRLCGADFHCLGLGSVRPEDRLVFVGPRVGVFDFEHEAVFEWLDLPCLGIRWCHCSCRLGPFALVAWGGGHPGGGVLRLKVDDGAVVGVEDPVDSGWRGARCGGFGQDDRLPKGVYPWINSRDSCDQAAADSIRSQSQILAAQ